LPAPIVLAKQVGEDREQHERHQEVNHADNDAETVVDQRDGTNIDETENGIDDAVLTQHDHECVALDQNTGPERQHDHDHEDRAAARRLPRKVIGHRVGKQERYQRPCETDDHRIPEHLVEQGAGKDVAVLLQSEIRIEEALVEYRPERRHEDRDREYGGRNHKVQEG
jgi:hypothetical protein